MKILFLEITKTDKLLNANSINFLKGFNYEIETTLKLFNLTIFKKISFSK